MEDKLEKEIAGLRIIIDRTTCIGSSNCISVAPDVLKLDDEKIVTFLDNFSHIEKDRIIEACSVCPVDALSIFDESGKQIVP